MIVSAELAAGKRKLMVKMMDALELGLAVKKLQEANPTLQYDTDEFGLIRVNGIEYRGEEYRDLKYPVKSEHPRPTIIEKLGTERIEWHAWDMSKFMAVHAKKIKVNLFLAKMVKDRKRRTIEGAHRTNPVPTIPPPSTSKPSQEPINILPAAPKPELKLIIDPSIIAPMALPKPTWKIFDEPPKQVLATSKGDHQLVTSKGDKVYRRKPGWLKGCVGILQDVQPAGLLGISDVLAIGRLGVG